MLTRTFPRTQFRLPVIAIAAMLAPVAGSVVAQESSPERERGSVLLGTFVTDRQTNARLDSDQGQGSDLDLENDLGLEDATSVARLGAYWWLTERQRLDFAYFDLSRDASKKIQRTIKFGDQSFVVNTAVDTQADLNVVKLDYTFAVLSRERGFLGITGGLYVAETELRLHEATLGTAESQDVTAPLPVIGLRGDFAMGKHIVLRGAFQIFDYSADQVDGSFEDLYVGADYSFAKRWAAGLAYNKVTMNLSATEDSGLKGALDWGYDGLLLYVKFDF